MTLLRRLIAWLSFINQINLGFCRLVAIFMAASIALVVATGVFWRYVLNDSLSWYEELAKFMMVWLVFVGAPMALRLGDHVAVEILPNALPPRLRAALLVVVSIIVVVFSSILLYYSAKFAWNGRTQVAIAIGDVSLFWIFVSIPFGAASLLLVSSQILLENIVSMFVPNSVPEDAFVTTFRPRLKELG